ncbi:MAG: DNA-directed RNA polymerase subunit alpha C-terminal domain-containing protein [Acidithiobacillus sp.]
MASDNTLDQITQLDLKLSLNKHKTSEGVDEFILPCVNQQITALQWLIDTMRMENVIPGNDLIWSRAALLALDVQDLAKRLAQKRLQEKQEKQLMRTIDDLPITIRTFNCLKAAGDIYYIGDLVQKSEQELLKLPKLGRKVLRDIKESLAMDGLALGMQIDNRLLDNLPRHQLTK